MKNMKLRLILLNFLEFAVWGAYLTSMGTYLATHGLATHIGWFYSIQGIVSLFMPALMGIVADRWIPAQKLLSLCHALAGVFMLGAGIYGILLGSDIRAQQLCCLHRIGQSRVGYRQRFPSYPRLRNGRFHCHYVDRGPLRLPKNQYAIHR